MNEGLGSIRKAHNEKTRKYQDFIDNQPRDTTFLPIALSTLGGWHPTAHEYISQISTEIAAQTGLPATLMKAHVFQRIATKTVLGNVRCLTEGTHRGLD